MNVLDRALTVDEQPRRFADKPVCSQSTQTGQFADCYQQRRLCAELYHQRLSAIGRSATYRKWPEAFPDLKFSVDAGGTPWRRNLHRLCAVIVPVIFFVFQTPVRVIEANPNSNTEELPDYKNDWPWRSETTAAGPTATNRGPTGIYRSL